MGPAAFVTLLILRRFGVIAREPVWTYVAVFVSIPVIALMTDYVYRRQPSRLHLHARVAVHVASVTVVIYMSGWGPMLVGAYAFVALENISHSSSKVWRVTTSWSLLGIAIGQIAIWRGWAPSLLSLTKAQTVGAMGTFVLIFLIRMAGATSEQKEKAEHLARGKRGPLSLPRPELLGHDPRPRNLRSSHIRKPRGPVAARNRSRRHRRS